MRQNVSLDAPRTRSSRVATPRASTNAFGRDDVPSHRSCRIAVLAGITVRLYFIFNTTLARADTIARVPGTSLSYLPALRVGLRHDLYRQSARSSDAAHHARASSHRRPRAPPSAMAMTTTTTTMSAVSFASSRARANDDDDDAGDTDRAAVARAGVARARQARRRGARANDGYGSLGQVCTGTSRDEGDRDRTRRLGDERARGEGG